MSVLSDGTIRRMLKERKIVVTPEPKRINPASIDVTLGGEVKRIDRAIHGEIDTREPYPDGILLPREVGRVKGLMIHPGEHYLATTVERFEMPPDVAMYIIGKSTVGRLGLVPVTAGWVDPGFHGQITLEIYNVGNVGIRVYEGMFFAQAVFYLLDEPAEEPYFLRPTSLYKEQTGATAPNTKNLYPIGWFDDVVREEINESA